MERNLHSLKSTPGSRPDKHRVGRGHAAGKGKQARKGQSGQNKRSGHRLGFEGGQTPWFRRIGKRGFQNVNHIEYQVINLDVLETKYRTNEKVDTESLFKKDIIKRNLPIKLLGNGKLTKKLTIKLHAISESAKKAVEAAGGVVETL